MRAGTRFEDLPVELIAETLSELDVQSLLTVSKLSRRLRYVLSDASLNPWRWPILQNLRRRDGVYESCMNHLGTYTVIPRTNWVDILSMAQSRFLLYRVTIPTLPDKDYEEAARRRFLPSWVRRQREKDEKEGHDDASVGVRWKETFLTILHRVRHRSTTTCTTDEAWTKYIVLNRNGSANLLDASSRSFSPLGLFNEMKIQNNLAHLETHIRLVVEFADVRILALGVLCKPRSIFTINENARVLLHPPGVVKEAMNVDSDEARVSPTTTLGSHLDRLNARIKSEYRVLSYPQPAYCHRNYPLFTPGGEDVRWSEALEEQGNVWVGGMLLTAQLVTEQTHAHYGVPPVLQDLDLVHGPGRRGYMSFMWDDLDAIAPWMDERIVKRINGQGLGI